MIRLSIIVPMYNVSPYIERCIRSLEAQDISINEYEIICVNDGSPDNCKEIVEDLQQEYSNIILINQENQGVSRARNNGIDLASGMYILFVDPDDYVDEKSFRRVLNKADEHETQVSFLGFAVQNEDGTISKGIFYDNYKSQIYKGIEIYRIARGDGRTDPDRMVAVLFKSEFINRFRLRYLPDVPYLEDGEFIARILCLADRCIFDGGPFYQRTTRPGSATNSRLFYSIKATDGFLLAAGNLRRFQQEQDLNEKQRVFLNQPVVKFVLLALQSSIIWGSDKRLSSTIKKLKNKSFNRINLEGCNLSYYLYGKSFNLSPYFGAFMLILFPRVKRLFNAFNNHN